MRRTIRLLKPTLIICLLALSIVRHEQLWWWIEVHTGTVNESGPYYAFWSGFGADLGEYTLLVIVGHGVYLHWKNINCHDPRCWRVGTHQAAGGLYKLCRHHHPDLMGKPVTLDLIHRHHHEHRERQAARGT